MTRETLERSEAPPASTCAASGGPIGRRNLVWGWCGIVLGPTLGSILMCWCFAGPLPSPLPWLEDYVSVERRMLRLAHVALVMLPVINILFGREIDHVALSDRWKRRASWLCALAIPGVPLGLTLAALVWVPLKWLSAPAVYSLIAGLSIMAVGQVRRARLDHGADPRRPG